MKLLGPLGSRGGAVGEEIADATAWRTWACILPTSCGPRSP